MEGLEKGTCRALGDAWPPIGLFFLLVKSTPAIEITKMPLLLSYSWPRCPMPCPREKADCACHVTPVTCLVIIEF